MRREAKLDDVGMEVAGDGGGAAEDGAGLEGEEDGEAVERDGESVHPGVDGESLVVTGCSGVPDRKRPWGELKLHWVRVGDS